MLIFLQTTFSEKQKIVEVGNRTTVSVIDRVPVYKNVYSRKFGALHGRSLIHAPGLLWDRSRGLHVRAKEENALAPLAKKLQQI